MAVIKKREQAKRDGDTIYYNGKACRKGHWAARYVSTGNCVQCVKASNGQRIEADKLERKLYVNMRVHVADVELVEAINLCRKLGLA